MFCDVIGCIVINYFLSYTLMYSMFTFNVNWNKKIYLCINLFIYEFFLKNNHKIFLFLLKSRGNNLLSIYLHLDKLVYSTVKRVSIFELQFESGECGSVTDS